VRRTRDGAGEKAYIQHFQVIGVVSGCVRVLHVLPDDLSFFRIFANHLEDRRLGLEQGKPRKAAWKQEE
jgi:hypothetical protein